MVVKRIVSAITGAAVLASAMSVFTGCSMKEFFSNEEKPSKAEPLSNGEINKGEWLAMVNDAFGMQVDENAENGELDAARDWGVVGEDEDIDMNAPIDDKFVASTLMRASGFADSNSTDEEIINSAVQHGIISDPNALLSDPAAAVESLEQAQDEWAHQEFEEHTNVELNDEVQNLTEKVSAKDIVFSGGDVKLPTEFTSSLSKDSVYVLPKDEKSGQGGAYKVLSTIDNGDGTTTVRSVPASVEEVYSKLDVSGKFAADVTTFEPANENVKVIYGEATGVSCTPDGGEIKPLGYIGGSDEIVPLGTKVIGDINFETEIQEGYKISASISDIELNADIDWDFGLFDGLDINRIYMGVDFEQTVSVEKEFGSIEKNLMDEITLGKTFLDQPSIEVGKLAVYICPGISVNLRVNLTFEASGKLTVSITTQDTKGFEMKGSKFRAINQSKLVGEEIVLAGEAGAYCVLTLALSLDYLVGEVDLLSLELKIGPTFKASLTVHNAEGTEKDMVCIDISGYLKVELKLYLMKTIMDLIGEEASITLLDLDESSSPIVWGRIHLENLKRTAGDVCTFEEETTEASTETSTIPVGIFAFEKNYVSLTSGSNSAITLKALPSGYGISDIKWESSDSSKVKVDQSGNITAVAPGSVSITASTKDGKYKTVCAVTVIKPVGVSSNADFPDNAVVIAA